MILCMVLGFGWAVAATIVAVAIGLLVQRNTDEADDE